MLHGRSAKLQLRHITGNDTFFPPFLRGEGIRISELKKPSITCATWRLRLKKYLQTLQQEGFRLQSCLMPWTPWSLHGKPSVTNASAYESGADLNQSADSLWLSPATVPEHDEMWDTLLLDTTLLCLCSDTAFLSATSVLTVSKTGRIFRLSHQPRRPRNAAGSCMLLRADSLEWLWLTTYHSVHPEFQLSLLKTSKV